MKKIDFNRNWTCRCLTRDEEPYSVTLPHDAMRSEPRTEESVSEGNSGWYLGGDYEYTKHVFVPSEYSGKKVLIEFESVYHNAEVYINGTKAAYRPYGYTNFYVDTEGLLKYEAQNEIRVIARNSDQPNSRWYSGTGIYRPVYLWTGDKKYIPVNGIKIHTVSYAPAVIEVEIKTSCPGMVKVEILNKEQNVLTKEIENDGHPSVFRMEIPNAKLWDCKHPNLYTLRATFGEDVVEETFGIRLLEWSPEKGLTINGKREILRGACVHHDNGVLGACTYPEAEERRIRILKENGYNAIRSSHYPCSKDMLDACDRLGMLVMDEYVDVWYIHKTKYDYVNYLAKWWQQDLKDMVEKDYNHPSVIMYSTGNEVAETAQKKGIELTGRMTSYLHKLDPHRPVTCGINIFFNFLSSMGMGVYSDDKAEKSAQSAKQEAEKKEKKKPVGSEFYNTLACLVGDYFMKIGATLPPCDWKTKDAYSFWEIAKKNKRILGDFVWSGWEYIGETGDGAAEYEEYKGKMPHTRMTGNNGRIDLLGKPRAEAAYTRVAFERETGPFIAVKPVYQKENLNLTGWALTKALESWSWRGCAGEKAEVEVFARAAEVELLVNGKKAARGKVKKCRTKFHIPYEDGEITAVSYDKNGCEINRQTLVTANKETMLHIKPEQETVEAGRLLFVPLQYGDFNGIWKPMEKHHLKVTVENATLEGLGSACSYVEGNYAQDTVDTYYGEAMAVVRAGESGSVKITVSDEEKTYTCEIPVTTQK